MKKSGEVIAHIGLPKTGTTTLQSFLGEHIGWFLGPSSLRPYRFRKAFVTQEPNWWTSRGSRSLVRDFQKLTTQARKDSPTGSVFFSWEGALTAHMFMTEETAEICRLGWRWFDHLENLMRVVFGSRVEITWLLTVRRQPEWLASQYAQRSIRIAGASQKDFDRQLALLLSSEGSAFPLDYHFVITELLKRFPGSRAVALPLEQFNQPEYRETLAELTQTKIPEEWWPRTKLNERRVSANSWALRPVNLDTGGKHPLSFRVARVSEQAQLASQENPLEKRTISLRPEKTRDVLDLFSSSNRELQSYSPLHLASYWEDDSRAEK